MAAQAQALISNLPGTLQQFREFQETRLSNLRPIPEFFDHQRISRPADLNEATSRISHNTRHFSGNYSVVIAGISVYALLTNPLLLIAIAFLVGGFAAINKFAPEPNEAGNSAVSQKSLYIGLFTLGLPLLFFAGPLSTLFFIVGASSVAILGHAALLEPSVESEYQQGSIEQV